MIGICPKMQLNNAVMKWGEVHSMVEIVFSGPAAGGLKTASSTSSVCMDLLKEEIKNNESNLLVKPIEKPELIIPLEFQWDIGYLDQAEDSDYRKKIPASLYYGHHVRLHPEDEHKLFQDGENNLKYLIKLKELAGEGKKFRIWYGNAAMELAGFYYICNVLKDYDVEVYSVSLPPYYEIGGKNKQIASWGMAFGFEFGYLIENEKKLTSEDVEYFSLLWEKLVEENAPLRAVVAGKLISVPEDFYDSLILSYFTEETIKENVWSSYIMSLGLGISSGFVEQRIWAMGKIGVIELLQDGESMNKRIWKKKS